MPVLVTGAAGFIGYHVTEALIARGESVTGFDSVNAYYDPALKQARLARLARHGDRFRLVRADLADEGAFAAALGASGADRVVHLAAQAGVRHSIEHPGDYIRANLVGHFNVVEACRRHGGIGHLVYASSSSVYGGNDKLPFSVEDKVDQPISLYAATKAADELISHSYAHIHGLPQTGLRFFTVYGPWGRPDMSAYIFTRAIFEGRPITVFNRGQMKRDFTYVDDIVDGVIKVLLYPPAQPPVPPLRIYNLGHHRPVETLLFVRMLEELLGKKAAVELLPPQPGDMTETCADLTRIRKEIGFEPKVPLEEGLRRFVDWFRGYYGV